MEIGNHLAMHEPERPESPNELIATARIQFEALAAIGVLTQGQATILYLLQGDGGTLSAHDRAFRDNIVRYLKKEADFVSVCFDIAASARKPAGFDLGAEVANRCRSSISNCSNRNVSAAKKISYCLISYRILPHHF